MKNYLFYDEETGEHFSFKMGACGKLTKPHINISNALSSLMK